ncbi:MAG: hypothetical protein Q4G05_06965, partial [Clostridia bacterium]|nr:hypothetical protein [Clostridia bacterium]
VSKRNNRYTSFNGYKSSPNVMATIEETTSSNEHIEYIELNNKYVKQISLNIKKKDILNSPVKISLADIPHTELLHTDNFMDKIQIEYFNKT